MEEQTIIFAVVAFVLVVLVFLQQRNIKEQAVELSRNVSPEVLGILVGVLNQGVNIGVNKLSEYVAKTPDLTDDAILEKVVEALVGMGFKVEPPTDAKG